jgi:hypothetical protein
VEATSGYRLVSLMKDLVAILPDGPRETWNLGDGLILHIPHGYQRAPQRGTVLGVGPRVQDLTVDDRVLYGRTSWVGWFNLTDDVHGPVALVFHERDILALIERGEDDPIS